MVADFKNIFSLTKLKTALALSLLWFKCAKLRIFLNSTTIGYGQFIFASKSTKKNWNSLHGGHFFAAKTFQFFHFAELFLTAFFSLILKLRLSATYCKSQSNFHKGLKTVKNWLTTKCMIIRSQWNKEILIFKSSRKWAIVTLCSAAGPTPPFMFGLLMPLWGT